MHIESEEDLPSESEGWGLGGTINRRQFTISNGDVWVCGTTVNRDSYKSGWIELYPNPERIPDSGRGRICRVLKGNPKRFIVNYYSRLGIEITV